MPRNNKQEFPKLKYPLSAEQDVYILKQHNAGLSMKKIFDLISSPDENIRPADVGRFMGNFNTFRQRVKRTLLKGVTVRRTSKKQIKLDTVDDKLKYIAGIMSDPNNRPDVKLKALEMFNELQQQAGLDKQDGSLLVANPNRIQITPELLRELFMMSKSDMGGLHTLNFDVLDREELKLLRQSVENALSRKPDIQEGSSI